MQLILEVSFRNAQFPRTSRKSRETRKQYSLDGGGIEICISMASSASVLESRGAFVAERERRAEEC